ncbi:MAG: A/G-specific adenine glycosylase [Coriobacteriia bacterium]|nr:A/G-specific adenine glycosylase [Coriobacteriia bacterium]
MNMREVSSAFSEQVWEYYAEHGRDLPWRRTQDPYGVVVSEIMLQQTQVSRVLPKWQEFIDEFCDFDALAAASLEDVLRVWSGLGYNRRAQSLKRIAEIVLHEHGGRLPQTLDGLTGLPGIGHATAAQILAFAFDTGVPFIETNIRAVYLHHYFEDAEDVPDSVILPIVEATMDAQDPRQWFYALMDYGTDLKKRLPNPSRRSKHHVKQSRFEGSTRQLRGHILRALIQTPGLRAPVLAETTGFEPGRVAGVLDALVAEGFLLESDGAYRIL